MLFHIRYLSIIDFGMEDVSLKQILHRYQRMIVYINKCLFINVYIINVLYIHICGN